MPMPDRSERNLFNLELKQYQLKIASGQFTTDEDTGKLVPVDEQHPIDESRRQSFESFVERQYSLRPEGYGAVLSSLVLEIAIAKTGRDLEVSEVWDTLNKHSPTLLGPRSNN